MAKRTKKEDTLTPEEKLRQTLVPVEEQPYPVPGNWCWTTIGDINRYKSCSIDPAKTPEKTFELYSVPSSADDYPEIVSGMEIGSTKQSVLKDDILLCKINPRINRVWKVAQHTENNLLASSEWIIIRNSHLNSDYLTHCFRAPYFRDYMLSNVSGVGGSLMRAQPKYVSGYPVPLPPLPEQHRIVACIESLFGKLDEVKEKAQAVIDGYEDRKAAILHKAFTGELTAKWREENRVTDSWKQKTLADVTINLDHKRIPLSKTERAGLAKIYDYYGASGIIDKVDNFIFEGKYILIGEDGANLVMRSKPIAFIAEGKFWVNNHAHILDVKSEILLDFLCFYINSIDLNPYVTGSAQPKMTQAKMNTIPVPVPPIHEQKQLIRTIANIISAEDRVKETAESILDQIDTMKKSILARAFRGELGTNDPSDEPAIDLLKRVLQEQG